MVEVNKVEALIKQIEDETKFNQIYFHKNPELSGQEINTVNFIKKNISHLPLKIIDIPHSTGFIAILDTLQKGKTLAIRTDIDALPINESAYNLNQIKTAISNKKGIMHACGHDGHMSIMISVIKILTEIKDRLTGKIIFVFEEGEETWSGINQTINFLQHFNIDAFYGYHLYAGLETGKVALDQGPIMAGAILLKSKILGKGGHVSEPEVTKNPILTAAHFLTEINKLWYEFNNTDKKLTLGFAQIHGGEIGNVIPDEVLLDGSIRFYDSEIARKGLKLVTETLEETANRFENQVVYDPSFGFGASPVYNDEYLVKIAKSSIKNLSNIQIEENIKWFASESFSEYRKIAPSIFNLIGIKNEQKGTGADHHSSKFEIDSDALNHGINLCIHFCLEYLKGE